MLKPVAFQTAQKILPSYTTSSIWKRVSSISCGLFANCLSCTTAYASNHPIKKLRFVATAPAARTSDGIGYHATVTNGIAELHPTGHILFRYTVNVKVNCGAGLQSWPTPAKITFKLFNEQGHLLKSFEVIAKDAPGEQSKDFPLDKEILQQTAKIAASMILLD